MDKKQLERYRRRLEQEQRAILQSIKRNQSAEADIETSGNLDEGDLAVNTYQKELMVALQDSEATRLRAIEEALNRLRNEDWGLCATCRKPIVQARLTAVPWTTLCIGCQDRIEKRRNR